MSRLCLSRIETLFLCSLVWFCSAKCQASGVALKPSTCDFGTITVNLKSASCTFIVTNNTGASTKVTGFSLTGSQFQLIYGLAPYALANSRSAFFTLIYAPTVPGPAAETLTINFTNQPSLVIPVTGAAVATSAALSPSATLLDFGAIEQGQISIAQPVTISNTGSQDATLVSITVDPPFFTDAVLPAVIDPAVPYTFNVYFEPGATTSFTDTVALTYDSLPPQGIDLIGTGLNPSAIAVTTFPTLPIATKKASYYAPLAAGGGLPPYTWSLVSGSTLPKGLALSSDGTISGTPTALGTSVFSTQVTDSSSPPLTAAATMSLSVNGPTGSVCNNTSWDVSGTSTPIVGLDVLGPNTYLGSTGGLYPNGSNIDDPNHQAFGIGLAQQIQPLDANGIPDPAGAEVLLIIGESNVFLEGQNLLLNAMASPGRNPSVVVVNGGQGGATAGKLVNPDSPYWATMTDYLLPNAGVTAQQVVAAWFEPTNAINSGTFPADMNQLYSQIETVLQNILVKFPNIKIVYMSSRTYSAYSNGKVTDNPEPYAFESGFAVKWTIQDQINGNPALNYDPNLGPVLAPWIEWGPYYWADGMLVPSLSNVTWTCQDFKLDGTHPTPSGAQKVANQVLNFLKTDPAVTPWFLAH